jgi:RNA polymerase sigma-70 factor (ECF subfamily)
VLEDAHVSGEDLAGHQTGVTDSRAAAYTGCVSAVESLPACHPDATATWPTFAAAARAHLDDVYRYLLYLTKDGTLAEDLTADTFQRALRAWPRFDPRRASERTWLCQLARTSALDHFRAERRRHRREERYARETETASDAPSPGGLSPELEHALGRLSPAEREVIALRVVLDLDGPAAARVLGIRESACSTRLSRALDHLRREMGNDD